MLNDLVCWPEELLIPTWSEARKECLRMKDASNCPRTRAGNHVIHFEASVMAALNGGPVTPPPKVVNGDH
jgi:hypothetical protein